MRSRCAQDYEFPEDCPNFDITEEEDPTGWLYRACPVCGYIKYLSQDEQMEIQEG